MYIVTLENQPDGVYSIFDDQKEQVIPLFVEHDDAERYLFMLEYDPEYPPMQICEIDSDTLIYACEEKGHKYSIITADDFLIPPKELT
jgi:hypothetical protein